MIERVYKHIIDNNLVNPGDTVICGVSAGVDSMVMLDIMCDLRDRLNIRVCGAYFNHHIRSDKETNLDADWVRMYCNGYGIEFFLGEGDVMGRVAETGESIEEAARALRYDFIENIIPGAKVATAHHANDNLETMLMNLIRGCGTQGLCGIPSKRGNIIRPMLCLTREEIVKYSEENRIGFIEDSTNKSDDYLRNRIRHSIIPMLQAENSNAIVNTMKASNILREDCEYLDSLADEQFARLEYGENGYEVDKINQLDGPIRNRVIIKILSKFGIEHTSSNISTFKNAIEATSGNYVVCLSCGKSVVYNQGRCSIVNTNEYNSRLNSTLDKIDINPNKTVNINSNKILCYEFNIKHEDDISRDTNKLMIKSSTIKGNLYIRSRESGDKIVLPCGTKSVGKALKSAGIALVDRNSIPVICDDTGVIGVFGVGVNMNNRVDIGDNVIIVERC